MPVSLQKPAVIAVMAMFATATLTAPALAVGADTSNPPPTTTSDPVKKPAKRHAKVKRQKTTMSPQWFGAYHAAYAAIHERGDYEGGIARLHAIGHDEDSDIATLIGYASRKMGRYDDARYWYDKALAATPDNARTLSYYGMWHAEQGNMLKANDYLAKVRGICGTDTCREYAELKAVIAGTKAY